MSITTPAELAAFMGVAENTARMQSAIDIAEHQVARMLGVKSGGGIELSEDVTVTFWTSSGQASERIGRSVAYGLGSGNTIEVPGGPLVALTSCDIDGTDRTAEVEIAGLWYLRFIDQAARFSAGAKIVLVADIGWDSNTVPSVVRSAALTQSAGVYSNLSSYSTGQVKLSESIGDYSVSYQPTQEGLTVFSPLALDLLRSIRRAPRLGA